MYIRNIGYNHSHYADFNIKRPNGSGDYLVLLVKTPAIFTLNSTAIVTEPYSFILYSEDTPQFYKAYGEVFSNDWFRFKLEENDLIWFDKLSIPQNKIIPLGDFNELSIIINNLCNETYKSTPHKSEITELYLKLFFIKLSNKINNYNSGISNNHYNKLSLIRSKIYNEPYKNWNIDDLSHETTMSKSSFQHLYKIFFGVSPITDVILSRVEHAKYLLSTTDITIIKISKICGYNNEIHFMRQFKKQTNLTPTEYRKNKKTKSTY